MSRWQIEGFQNHNITDNDQNEATLVKVFEQEYNPKATDRKSLRDIFYAEKLDVMRIRDLHDGDDDPYLLRASDINTHDVVYFELSNPTYTGDQCNIMEYGCKFPEEKLRIIETIKLAVRCGLDIKFGSANPEADKWTHDYYEYYKS